MGITSQYQSRKQIGLSRRSMWPYPRLAMVAACILSLSSPVSFGAEVENNQRLEAQHEDVLSGAADERIRGAVRKALITDPKVRVFDMVVDVQSGVVTLNGRVGTSAEKHLAARYAGDVLGVEGVVNAIDVQPGLRYKAKPNTELTTDEREAIAVACGNDEENTRQLSSIACFARLDRDGDGVLNPSEAAYLAAIGERFRDLDADGGGQLTPGELKRYFGASPAARAGALGY